MIHHLTSCFKFKLQCNFKLQIATSNFNLNLKPKLEAPALAELGPAQPQLVYITDGNILTISVSKPVSICFAPASFMVLPATLAIVFDVS